MRNDSWGFDKLLYRSTPHDLPFHFDDLAGVLRSLQLPIRLNWIGLIDWIDWRGRLHFALELSGLIRMAATKRPSHRNVLNC